MNKYILLVLLFGCEKQNQTQSLNSVVIGNCTITTEMKSIDGVITTKSVITGCSDNEATKIGLRVEYVKGD